MRRFRRATTSAASSAATDPLVRHRVLSSACDSRLIPMPAAARNGCEPGKTSHDRPLRRPRDARTGRARGGAVLPPARRAARRDGRARLCRAAEGHGSGRRDLQGGAGGPAGAAQVGTAGPAQGLGALRRLRGGRPARSRGCSPRPGRSSSRKGGRPIPGAARGRCSRPGSGPATSCSTPSATTSPPAASSSILRRARSAAR